MRVDDTARPGDRAEDAEVVPIVLAAIEVRGTVREADEALLMRGGRRCQEIVLEAAEAVTIVREAIDAMLMWVDHCSGLRDMAFQINHSSAFHWDTNLPS